MEITLLLEFDRRSQLRRWLEKNHATAKECWVTVYRVNKVPDLKAVLYTDLVEEALCFGWIDSTLKKLPDGRTVQRISPRRKNSNWTERNRERCAKLEALGLMTDAGREALRRGR